MRACLFIKSYFVKCKTRVATRLRQFTDWVTLHLHCRVLVSGVILLNKTRAVLTGCHRFAIKREQRTHCSGVEHSRTAVMRARSKIISRNRVARELDACDSSTKSVFGGRRQFECKSGDRCRCVCITCKQDRIYGCLGPPGM